MDKQEKYRNLTTLIFSFIILAFNTLVWAYVWISEYAEVILRPFGYKGNWLLILIYWIILMLFTSFYGGYKVGYHLPGDVILSSVLSLVITNTITYFQSSLIGRALLSLAPFVLMTVVQVLFISVWSFVTSRIYLRKFPPYKMLLIYGGDKMARSLVRKMITRDERYQIKEVLNCSEDNDKILEKIDQFGSVVLCDLPPKERNAFMKYCFDKSISVYLTPKISEIIVRGAEDVTLFDTPLILSENQGISLEQKFVKRAFDLVVSVLALIITSPFMLLTAVAIKLQDGGAVLYKQERLTLEGKCFYVYKFRSMVVDAEKDTGAKLATENDSRITPIGKFIRAIRFDELPQIWNILNGEMSIVGPRPERPEIANDYEKDMPEFRYRLKVKAGLTGYAQVYGKYNTTPYDKLKLDLMYISKYSFLTDIKILMMTVKILFVKSSTEGVLD